MTISLIQKLKSYDEDGYISKEIPEIITENLNPKFLLREYQKKAFQYFIHLLKINQRIIII